MSIVKVQPVWVQASPLILCPTPRSVSNLLGALETELENGWSSQFLHLTEDHHEAWEEGVYSKSHWFALQVSAVEAR